MIVFTSRKVPVEFVPPSQPFYDCPSSRNGILLTIDNSPTNHTDRILDLLHYLNMSAIFFLSKENIHSNPKMLKKIVNTSLQHDFGYLDTDDTYFEPSSISAEVRLIEIEIENITGNSRQIKFYRPAYLNSTTFNETTVANLVKLGYSVVLHNRVSLKDINLYYMNYMKVPRGIYRLTDGSEETIDFLESLINFRKKSTENFKIQWAPMSPKQCFERS